MKTVCHLTSAHDNNDSRIYYKECCSLNQAGLYHVYLIAPGDTCIRDGINIIGVDKSSDSRLLRMFKITKAVYKKALEVDADIYHFHDPELLPYGLKLKKKGKKVIFDSHENYTMQIVEKKYIPKNLRKIVSKLYHAYETHVLKRIDAVIVPCSFEGKNIFDHRAKRSEIIANYPVLSAFYEKYQDNTRKSDYICYTGALSFNRGITYLIKAAYKANVKLVLAGEFSSQTYAEETMNLPEFSCVEYRGCVGQNEVFEIYSQAFAGASIFLTRGQYGKVDTFGIKIFEFMAMGLPVIISSYPYACDVLKEYNYGICVPLDDIDAIAAAICYLKEHPDVAYKMGQEGRRAVLEKFNWSTEEKKLLALYTELI